MSRANVRSGFGMTTDLPVTPCDVCGATEASCGYDEAGLPYVHCSPTPTTDPPIQSTEADK